ncbi:MAG: aldehyde dehydrogenase family protein [Alphaproteobacteria bacterium]|nr:aldehyde dehydrogenase family protein [Alphaproteobacteria bacterium]
MRDLTKFHIGGAWVAPLSPRPFEVVDPATEDPFARISLGAEGDVDRAVAAARKAFETWGTASRDERLALMNRIRDEYARRYDDLVDAVTSEMGAPTALSREAQVAAGAQHLDETIRVLSEFAFEEQNGRITLVHEPIGVCGLITPWNWPLNQIALKVFPAIAAGCTVVLKPSELAPVSGMIVAEIIDAAKAPAGVFNLVNGDGPTVGQALAKHPDIDMVSFTGSTRGGVAVTKAAADTVKRVTLELGGKSANVILDDADLAAAVERGVLNCFGNTGQSCNAPTRMLVPRRKHDEAIAAARAAAESVVVGPPRADDTTMGPLAHRAQFDKVRRMIRQGIEDGATLVAGGAEPARDKGYFVQPTVFAGVTNDMTIAREEIFGPVLCILPYDGEDDAVRIANDTPYGLAAYVESGDEAHAKKVASRLRAGNVHINGASEDPAAPFGGYKRSGNGREAGAFGFKEYLEVKAILT